VLDRVGINSLATLPSLDELRARFLGMLQTPATRIATVLQAPGTQLARVLSAYASKAKKPPEPMPGPTFKPLGDRNG